MSIVVAVYDEDAYQSVEDADKANACYFHVIGNDDVEAFKKGVECGSEVTGVYAKLQFVVYGL